MALLALHGFDEIVVTVAFLANQIRDYFGDGSDFGVSMRYATEDSPLGTAGSVRNASAELDDTFLVISGDVLTDIDLTAFVKAHRDASASASIALKHVDNPLEFGIVITQPDGSIERFLEKPSWGEVFSDTINTGIYVLEPDVFDFIPEDEVVDFSGDVFPALLEAGHTMHGHVIDDYWEDVGTLDGVHPRAHRRPRRPREGRHRRLPARRRPVDRHRRRDQPAGPHRRAGRDRRQLPDRSGRAPARVHRARHRRHREGRRVPRARGVPRPRLRRARHQPAWLRDRAQHRPARARARRGRHRRRQRVLRRPGRGDQPEREGLPVQDGRVGRDRHLVDRVGEPRRAHALRPPRRARPGQRRHQPRGGRCASRWRTAPSLPKGSTISTSRDTSRLAARSSAG